MGWDTRSRKRIADVVRKVENEIIDLVPPTRSSSGSGDGGGVSFPGVVFLKGNRFFDSSRTNDTRGTGITNNLGGMSSGDPLACLKVILDGSSVSYEQGPMPTEMPKGEEWYYVAEQRSAIHII